jgi:hypothetical protein
MNSKRVLPKRTYQTYGQLLDKAQSRNNWWPMIAGGGETAKVRRAVWRALTYVPTAVMDEVMSECQLLVMGPSVAGTVLRRDELSGQYLVVLSSFPKVANENAIETVLHEFAHAYLFIHQKDLTDAPTSKLEYEANALVNSWRVGD